MSVRAGRPTGALICGAVILGQLLSGCTPAEPQATTTPSTTVSLPSEPSSPDTLRAPSLSRKSPSLTADYALTININISERQDGPERREDQRTGGSAGDLERHERYRR